MNAAFILSKMHCPSQLDFDSSYIGAIFPSGGASKHISLMENHNFPFKSEAVILDDFQWDTRIATDEQNGVEDSVLHSGHSGMYQNVLKRDAVHCEKRFGYIFCLLQE